MDGPWFYEIRIESHLTDRWSDWFDGLAIRHDPNGDTVICGLLADQAALLGVLYQIHALNLRLTSVNRLSPEGCN